MERREPERQPRRNESNGPTPPDLFRGIVLPAIGAFVLLVLFFTVLLSAPGREEAQPAALAAVRDRLPTRAAGGAEPRRATTATTAADDAPIATTLPEESIATTAPAETEPCIVPTATGEIGVVATRFAGRPTSSGRDYDPRAAVCIVNAGGPLGQLAYMTEIRLIGAGDGASATCRIIGRWNGAERPDRIALVSAALAKQLGIGKLGLLEVATGCPGAGTPQVAARFVAARR